MLARLGINEIHADFVLQYARKDGLESLVRELNLSEDKKKLKADLQPDLIQAFSNKFPDTDLKHLDSTVEWVLITSVAKRREKNER